MNATSTATLSSPVLDEYRTIPLRNSDLVVRVDAADYERMALHGWSLIEPKHPSGKRVAGRQTPSPNSTTVLFHRALAGVVQGQFVWFENGDPLDCRRANWRIVDWHEHRALRCGGDTSSARPALVAVGADTEWRSVPLHNSDSVALVDAADYERIAGHSWRLKRLNGHPYVLRRDGHPPRAIWLLHREVLDVHDHRRVRFRNGNPLDCRRANLEVFGAAEHRPFHWHGAELPFFFCRPCREYHDKEHLHYRPVASRLADRVSALKEFCREYFAARARRREECARIAACRKAAREAAKRAARVAAREARARYRSEVLAARAAERVAAREARARATAAQRARWERLFRTRTPDEIAQLRAWREQERNAVNPRAAYVVKIPHRQAQEHWKHQADKGDWRGVTPSFERYSNTRLDLGRGLALLSEQERTVMESWALGRGVVDDCEADAIVERLRTFVDTGVMPPATARTPVSDAEAIARASRETDPPHPLNAETRMLATRYAARRQRIGRRHTDGDRAPTMDALKSEASLRHQRRIDLTPMNVKRKRGVNAPSRHAMPGTKRARTIAQRHRRK